MEKGLKITIREDKYDYRQNLEYKILFSCYRIERNRFLLYMRRTSQTIFSGASIQNQNSLYTCSNRFLFVHLAIEST